MLAIESTFDLSDDEYRKVQAFADELFSLWMRADENNVEAVEAAINRMYARERCSAPFIFWCDSPWQLHMMPSLLDSMTEETRFASLCSPKTDPITERLGVALSKARLEWPAAWQHRAVQIVGAQRVAQWREACARAHLLMWSQLCSELQAHPGLNPNSLVWGRWAADLLPVYASPILALASNDEPAKEELLAQISDLYTLRCGAFAYTFRHCSVFVCKNPVSIKVDSKNRLHCDDGPAVEFADGYALYCWAGLNIDPDLVVNPKSLTIERIDAEQNIELRRVMIEKFGTARFVHESGAVLIAEDECGELLRKEIPGDEPIQLVKVTNSTPEPDGTFKTYFLRVPPDMVSPREAVAWTFGLNPDEYDPQLQT